MLASAFFLRVYFWSNLRIWRCLELADDCYNTINSNAQWNSIGEHDGIRVLDRVATLDVLISLRYNGIFLVRASMPCKHGRTSQSSLIGHGVIW